MYELMTGYAMPNDSLEIGCGNATHDTDCLCDVIIPVGHTHIVMNDAVRDMWMGPQICDIRGYGVPWTTNGMLDYFTDLCTFYDAWSKNNISPTGAEYPTLGDVPPPILKDTAFEKWAVIRQHVLYCLDNYDAPIMDILYQLGITANDFIMAATTGKPWHGHNGTPEILEYLELAFMSEDVNYTDVIRDTGIPRSTVYGLKKYWKVRRHRKYGDAKKRASKYLHELCNTAFTPTDVVRLVYERHGVQFSLGAVSKYRSRNPWHGHVLP